MTTREGMDLDRDDAQDMDDDDDAEVSMDDESEEYDGEDGSDESEGSDGEDDTVGGDDDDCSDEGQYVSKSKHVSIRDQVPLPKGKRSSRPARSSPGKTSASGLPSKSNIRSNRNPSKLNIRSNTNHTPSRSYRASRPLLPGSMKSANVAALLR